MTCMAGAASGQGGRGDVKASEHWAQQSGSSCPSPMSLWPQPSLPHARRPLAAAVPPSRLHAPLPTPPAAAHMFVDVAAVFRHHHGGCVPLLEQCTHFVQHSCVGRQALRAAPACNRLRQMRGYMAGQPPSSSSCMGRSSKSAMVGFQGSTDSRGRMQQAGAGAPTMRRAQDQPMHKHACVQCTSQGSPLMPV